MYQYEFLSPFLHKKWNNLSFKEKNELAKNFVEFHLPVCGTNSFNSAQITSGGVSLLDIDLLTMQSRLIKKAGRKLITSSSVLPKSSPRLTKPLSCITQIPLTP